MEPEVTMFGLLIQLAIVIVITVVFVKAAMRELDMSNRSDSVCDEHIKKTKEYLNSKRSLK